MRVVSCKVSVVPVTDTSPPRPRRLLALIRLLPLINTEGTPGAGFSGFKGSGVLTCKPGDARSCTWPPRNSPSTASVLLVTLSSRPVTTIVPPSPALLLADTVTPSSFTACAASSRISPPRTAPSARNCGGNCGWPSSVRVADATPATVAEFKGAVFTPLPVLLACSNTLPPVPCALETSITPAFSMRCA